MALNCINFNSEEFQKYAQELGVKPIILATKVKLYNQKNNQDLDYRPTAEELGLTVTEPVSQPVAEPVAEETKTFDPQALEDELAQETKLKALNDELEKEYRQLIKQRTDIETELAGLSMFTSPRKVFIARKKLKQVKLEISKIRLQQIEVLDQLIALSEKPAEVPSESAEVKTEPSVSIENNEKVINTNTPFKDLPKEVQFNIIQGYVNTMRIPVDYNINNQEETLANYDKSYDDIIGNYKSSAWYIQAIADYNNSVLNPVQQASVEESMQPEEEAPEVSESVVEEEDEETEEVAAPEPAQAQSVEAFENDLQANSEFLSSEEIASFSLSYGIAEDVDQQLDILTQVANLILQRKLEKSNESNWAQEKVDEYNANKEANLKILGSDGFAVEGKKGVKKVSLQKSVITAIRNSQFIYLPPAQFLNFIQNVKSLNAQFNAGAANNLQQQLEAAANTAEQLTIIRNTIASYSREGFVNPVLLNRINAVLRKVPGINFKYQYQNKYNHGSYNIVKTTPRKSDKISVAVETPVEVGAPSHELLGFKTIDEAVNAIEISNDPDVVAYSFLLSGQEFNVDAKNTEVDKKSIATEKTRSKYHSDDANSLDSVLANYLPDLFGGIPADYDVTPYYNAAVDILNSYENELQLKKDFINAAFSGRLKEIKFEIAQAEQAAEEFRQFDEAAEIFFAEVDLNEHFELYDQMISQQLGEDLSKDETVDEETDETDFLSILKAEQSTKTEQAIRFEDLANRYNVMTNLVNSLRVLDSNGFEVLNFMNLYNFYSDQLTSKQIIYLNKLFFEKLPLISDAFVTFYEKVGNIEAGNYKVNAIVGANNQPLLSFQNSEKTVNAPIDRFLSASKFQNANVKFEAFATEAELAGETINTEMNKVDATEMLDTLKEFFTTFTDEFNAIKNMPTENLNQSILEEINKCK